MFFFSENNHWWLNFDYRMVTINQNHHHVFNGYITITNHYGYLTIISLTDPRINFESTFCRVYSKQIDFFVNWSRFHYLIHEFAMTFFVFNSLWIHFCLAIWLLIHYWFAKFTMKPLSFSSINHESILNSSMHNLYESTICIANWLKYRELTGVFMHLHAPYKCPSLNFRFAIEY